MKPFSALLASLAGVISLAATIFLVFKGATLGFLGGAVLSAFIVGKEAMASHLVFGFFGGALGAFAGFILSSVVDAVLLPLTQLAGSTHQSSPAPSRVQSTQRTPRRRAAAQVPQRPLVPRSPLKDPLPSGRRSWEPWKRPQGHP